MKLNTEKITKGSRFWQQVNLLAKEAFPPAEYLAPDKLAEMSKADNFDYFALKGSDCRRQPKSFSNAYSRAGTARTYTLVDTV